VSDLDRINRRLDLLLQGGAGFGATNVVVINNGERAYPGSPYVARFVNAHGRRRTLMSEGEESLAAFLDRTAPRQHDDGFRLALVGGLVPEPWEDQPP
jgi:hypothetical protein